MRRLFIAVIVLALLAAGAYLFVRALLASDVVRATMQHQLSERLQQPVRVGGAHAVLFPRVAVDLRDIDIGEPVSVHLDSVRVTTGLRGLWSRVVTDAEVTIDGGRIALPLPFSLGPHARPAPDAPASGALTIASVRVISVRDVTLTGGGETLLIDLESSLEGDRLDIRTLSARAARTRLDAAGVIMSLAKLEGAFEATANPFDLNEIIAVGSGLSGTGEPDRPDAAAARRTPLHMVVAFAAPEGRFGTYPFHELATTLDVTPGHLKFQPLSMRSFGGSFAGQLRVSTAAAVPQLQLDGRLDNLDFAELLSASGFAGGITGRFGGTVSLAGAGSEVPTLINNAKGRINAVVTGGRVPGLDMVRTIVLAFGKPSGAPAAGSGSSFSRLGGSFALDNGVLSSRDLIMQSRDFDLTGEGSVRLSSGAVQARVDVVLSPELTAQAGTDLRRYAQEDGRVILPATIGGTLQHPKVSVDIAAATRRALTNELKRRGTSLLERLLKKK